MSQLQSFFVLVSLLIINTACSTSVTKTDKNQAVELSPIWVQDSLSSKNSGFRKINRASPLIYKDQIIVANSFDGLASFRLLNKNKVWSLNIPEGVESSGTVINDRLFIGSNNGSMYSVDLTSGKILWSFSTKSELVAEPLLNDGLLYFISGNQAVFSVDAATGKQVWTYNRQDTANLMTIRGGSKPALSNGILYVGFSDGSFVALNAKTGTPQWEMILNRNARFKDIDASPVIDGDNIYVNSYDDSLYCLSKNKGEIIWKAPFGGFSTPLVAADKVITSSSKGELVSLNKKTGSVMWKRKTDKGLFVDPILFKNYIVTGESQGNLNLIDLTTGELKSSFEPGRGVFSKATIQTEQKMIYFISGEGNLYSLKLSENISNKPYYIK